MSTLRLREKGSSLIKLMLLPQNIEIHLPFNSALTDLEFELHGKKSIPFGCRSGACGACLIEVVDGISSFNTKGEDETAFLVELGFPGDAFRLACQCKLLAAATIRPLSLTE